MNELISQSTSEGQPEVTGSLETKLREYIYNAITGSSSRLVISSMSQELPAAQNMEFEDYLWAMGEKFMPAAESIQMEAEYRDQKQGKYEDVQNYSLSMPSTSYFS